MTNKLCGRDHHGPHFLWLHRAHGLPSAIMSVQKNTFKQIKMDYNQIKVLHKYLNVSSVSVLHVRVWYKALAS